MSDSQSAQAAAPTTASPDKAATTNAPQKARKRSQKGSKSNPLAGKTAFSVDDLARARLRKRGIRSDERLADEKKVVRGILRRNFPTVRKNDAAVRKAKDTYNDRKPWPTNMNKSTAELVVNGKGSS